MYQTPRLSAFVRALALAFVLAPLAARAGDGRVAIGQGASFPYTISAPGHYYLTGDVTWPVPGGPVLLINADNVTLDLNGRTLTNSSGATAYGITIGDGRNHIVIRNGRVMAGNYGIVNQGATALNSTDILLDSLSIETTAAGGRAIGIFNGSWPGVLISNLVVRGCRLSAYGNALHLTGISNAQVTDNVMRGTNAAYNPLQVLNSTGMEIRHNEVTGGNAGININFTAGVAIGQNRIVDNLVSNAVNFGIYVQNSRATMIRGNTVIGTLVASSFGILCSSGSNNVVTDNQIMNFQFGLSVATSSLSIYSGNRLVGNTTPLVGGGSQSGGNNCDGTTCS